MLGDTGEIRAREAGHATQTAPRRPHARSAQTATRRQKLHPVPEMSLTSFFLLAVIVPDTFLFRFFTISTTPVQGTGKAGASVGETVSDPVFSGFDKT
jgi:hypothetical protein